MANKAPLKTQRTSVVRARPAAAFRALSGIFIKGTQTGIGQEKPRPWLPQGQVMDALKQVLAAVPAQSGQLVIDVADARRSFGFPKKAGALHLLRSGAGAINYGSKSAARIKEFKPARNAVRVLPQPRPNSENPDLIRRQEFIRALKDAEGGAYSGRELGEYLQSSRQSLAERRGAHTVVYWTNAHRQAFYPKWQFDEEFKVMPGVRTILKLLNTDDALHVLATFLVPAAALDDKTVLQLIRENRTEQAIQHVESSRPR